MVENDTIYKNIFNEIHNFYYKFVCENNKIEYYCKRMEYYKSFDYKTKCEYMLRDLNYELSYYDRFNSYGNINYLARLSSKINKEYYNVYFEYLNNKFECVEKNIEYIINKEKINKIFKNRVNSIIKGCENNNLSVMNLLLLIDNELYNYYNDYKSNNKCGIKELSYLKQVEEKYIKRIERIRLKILFKEVIKELKEINNNRKKEKIINRRIN